MSSKNQIGDLLRMVAGEMQGELDALREARRIGRYKRATQTIYRLQQGINDLRALADEAKK